MAGLGGRWVASLALGAVLCSPVWGQMVIPPGGGIDLGGGSFGLPCLGITMQGELTLGSGTLESGSLSFDIGATVTGAGGQLNVSGDLTSSAPLDLGTTDVVLSDSCAPGSTLRLSGNIIVNNLTLLSTGVSSSTIVLPAGTNLTVLGTLTLGSPGHPVVLTSSGPGVAIVTLGPSATVVNLSGSVIPPNVQIGAAASPVSIPTLDTYGLVLMSLLLGGWALRRRRRSPHF